MLDVKICGLTNAGDASFALESGADYLGFVLYKGSPRGIGREDLRCIVRDLPDAARCVGVFVNEAPEVIEDIVAESNLVAAQLNGDEDSSRFAGISCRIWRAVRLERDIVSPDPNLWDVERYVVDTAVKGMYGGTGVTADWTLASEFARGKPVMLAGGLTSANVVQAVKSVGPAGVDVSSGVESAPGVKDRGAVRDFIQRARSAARQGHVTGGKG
ncbi:MAG: phosphoribosylanthranilate isomerase [Verrucomicrobiota bacterium]